MASRFRPGTSLKSTSQKVLLKKSNGLVVNDLVVRDLAVAVLV
jgi:hypothetical protein